MTRLLLIRHGQSATNISKQFTGQLDPPLSEVGKVQAEKTADFIAKNWRVDEIFSSDLKRAMQTAEPLARLLKKSIRAEPRLREIYAGAWQGLPFDEIEAKYPAEWQVWKNDIGRTECPQGEKMSDFFERILRFVKELCGFCDGKTVVVTSHATAVRAMICAFKNLPVESLKDVAWTPNSSVSEAEFSNGKFSLLQTGLCTHLDGLVTNLPKNV